MATTTTKTATTTPARNGRRKFSDQLKQFLADLDKHDCATPSNRPLDGPRQEWEKVRDSVLVPLLNEASDTLMSMGRRGKIELTPDGSVKWCVMLYDSRSARTYTFGFAIADDVTQLTLADDGVERRWPLASVTPASLGDKVLGILIQQAYSRSV